MKINDITDDMLYEAVHKICSDNEKGLVWLHYYKGVSLTLTSSMVGKTSYIHARDKLENITIRLFRYFKYRQYRKFIYFYIYDLVSSSWTRQSNKHLMMKVNYIFMIFMGYNKDLIANRYQLNPAAYNMLGHRIRTRLVEQDLDFLGKEISESLY